MENIRCLKREHALAQVRNLVRDTPEIGLDSLMHIVQNLTPSQRAEVAKVIGRLEGSPPAAGGSVNTTSGTAGSPAASADSIDSSPSVSPE